MIVNSHGTKGNEKTGATITGNHISHPDIAIQIIRDAGPVKACDNTIADPRVRGITIDTTDPKTSLRAHNNDVTFTTPGKQRAAFSTYSSAPHPSRSHSITGDHVRWSPGTAGKADHPVKIADDNTRVTGNIFDGGGGRPYIGSPGSTNGGLVLDDNTFTGGATHDVSRYRAPMVNGNQTR